jgi:serine/threonine protein phosphatase PrpC
VVFLSAPGATHTVFLVCDGHGGVDAAQATVDNLPKMLLEQLPEQLPRFESRAGEQQDATRMSTLNLRVFCMIPYCA